MSSKLTLYIEDDVIKHVKSYAKAQKLSVSKVVNNFLTLLKDHKPEKETVDAPLTDSLQGVLKEETLSKEDYHHYLEEKYL
jgi:Holliday junction resolvasome RuvABC endonuclease subunit